VGCADVVGSLICGLAPTSVALIVGRAIAGCGGAVNPPLNDVDGRESSLARSR
jgi:hypothetical protein